MSSKTKYGTPGLNFFSIIKNQKNVDFDYFAFCDQDDIWFPNKLIKAINCLSESNSNCYSSSFHAYYSPNDIVFKTKYPVQKKYDYMFQSPGPGCTFILDKLFFLNFQKFLIINFEACSRIYYHDWFIYAYARVNDYEWYLDKNSYIYYRQHKSNDTGANISLKATIYRMKLLTNNFIYKQVFLTSKVLGYTEILDKLLKYPSGVFYYIRNASKFRRDYFGRVVILFLLVFKMLK